MQTPANDDRVGLGLVVTIENGQLKVISPQDGSPAARGGDQAGGPDRRDRQGADLRPDPRRGRAEAAGPGRQRGRTDLAARQPARRSRSRSSASPTSCRPWPRVSRQGISDICALPASTAATPAALAGAVQDLRQRSRQQADRLYPRSAEQSRRQLRCGGRRRRCLHRQGRHRRRQGPQAGQPQADHRHSGRHRSRRCRSSR